MALRLLTPAAPAGEAVAPEPDSGVLPWRADSAQGGRAAPPRNVVDQSSAVGGYVGEEGIMRLWSWPVNIRPRAEHAEGAE